MATFLVKEEGEGPAAISPEPEIETVVRESALPRGRWLGHALETRASHHAGAAQPDKAAMRGRTAQ